MPGFLDSRDHGLKPKSPARRVLIGFLFCLLVISCLGLAALVLISKMFWWDMGDRITVLGESATTEKVSSILYGSHLWHYEYYHEIEYRADGSRSVVRQMTRPIPGLHGLRGLSTSGGMHGDGDDWYEAYLSPELVANLEAQLGPSCIEKAARRPPDVKNAPKWWPAFWPPGVIRREQNMSYFVLTPGGGKGWFYTFRM